MQKNITKLPYSCRDEAGHAVHSAIYLEGRLHNAGICALERRLEGLDGFAPFDLRLSAPDLYDHLTSNLSRGAEFHEFDFDRVEYLESAPQGMAPIALGDFMATFDRVPMPLKTIEKDETMSDTKALLNDPIEHVIEAARLHGEDSEPDHEVGDLQDLLRAMWQLLPEEKRSEFLRTDVVEATLVHGAIESDLPYIHGDWTHLFGVGRREDLVRLLYDTTEGRIVAMQVANGPIDGEYVNATKAQIDDVQDSLKNANPEALEDPDDWSLTRSYEPPAWAIEAGILERESEPVVRDAPRG